ncbi:MAG TPA: hypothetical protein PK843_19650 [bacterium]|nr:hypothetical protein [bacterium]
MTKVRLTQIGIDRLVRLDWLEKVSFLVLAGNNVKEVKGILQNDLKDLFRSTRTNVRGSLDKTITILLKIWLTSPPLLDALRMEGLDLIKHLPQQDHLVVHWGMVTAVYPFWSGVARHVGRLLRLQGTATAAHVQRRMREQYGERETVSRRTRYALRSYLDWGVIQETGTMGIYSAGTTLTVDADRLIAWLVEASLHARANHSAPLKELIKSPSLFPFRIKPVQAETIAAASTRLDLVRHGLDDDLILLRKQ